MSIRHDEAIVVLTLAFMVVRQILGLVGLGPSPDAKDLEIAMLRHQPMVLRQQVARAPLHLSRPDGPRGPDEAAQPCGRRKLGRAYDLAIRLPSRSTRVMDLNTFRNRVPQLERVHLQNAVAGQASDNAQVTGLAEYWHPTGAAPSADRGRPGSPRTRCQGRPARGGSPGPVPARTAASTDRGSNRPVPAPVPSSGQTSTGSALG